MSDDELSSIPNLISPTTALTTTEQSGPLSLTATSETSEAVTPALQEADLDYEEQLELTQVRKDRPVLAVFNLKLLARKN